MSDAQTPVPNDHPIMTAWRAYTAGDAYANSFRWAADEQHRKGSMWAAFMEGWDARGYLASVPISPAEIDEQEEMQAQLWAAGLSMEDAAFAARMLWHRGIRFTSTPGHEVSPPTGTAEQLPSGGSEADASTKEAGNV